MAIWTPGEGATPRFGVSGGDVWAAGQGSPTLANMPRGANKLARRQFQSWTKRGPWETHWLELTEEERNEWEEFAAENLFHGLTGQPAIIPAKEYFVRYWSQATLFNGSEPSSPWAPPTPPTWDADNQPFEPWLDAEDGMAVVIKSTTTVERWFFFVAQPPKVGRGNLSRARCVPIGRHHLMPQEAGYRWHEPADAAVALFGEEAESSMSQQWLLAWELSGWFPRPVLDPCFSPPVQTGYPMHVTGFGSWDGVPSPPVPMTWSDDYGAYVGDDVGYAILFPPGAYLPDAWFLENIIEFRDVPGIKSVDLGTPLGVYVADAPEAALRVE